MKIQIDLIQDGGAQMRVRMDSAVVIEYAEEMQSGAVFPPVIVYGNGDGHWLADGFHRVEAAKKIGHVEIAAEVREGSSRDAILFGIGANASHGLRRTQDDKRQAIQALLADDEWSRLSDRKIAKMAKVDHKTVAKVRREIRDGGEIPTMSRPETQARLSQPETSVPRTSALADFLRTVSDDDLSAEYQRRGLGHV